jgi:hypothetical protein
MGACVGEGEGRSGVETIEDEGPESGQVTVPRKC